MPLFAMKVTDTFRFENGRTVFVGELETESSTIPACDCDILVNNEVKVSLRIDGEEIPRGNQTPNRAISTSQPIDLSSCGLGQGGFTIRSRV